MSRRITIVITDENDKKLRKIQSKRLKEQAPDEQLVSYASIVNDVLTEGLKKIS